MFLHVRQMTQQAYIPKLFYKFSMRAPVVTLYVPQWYPISVQNLLSLPNSIEPLKILVAEAMQKVD
jgi:hypothetical protein